MSVTRVYVPMLLAALLLTITPLTVMGCGGSPTEVSAVITSFEPQEGSVRPGDPAVASVRVENTGAEYHTLWIGYSVQDSAGTWYDAPARVCLTAHEGSHIISEAMITIAR